MSDDGNPLRDLAASGLASLYPLIPRVSVGLATCGVASGAATVYEALANALKEASYAVRLTRVGCRGMCWAEPLVEILVPGMSRMLYANVQPEDVPDLVRALVGGDLPSAKRLGHVCSDYHVLAGARRSLARDTTGDLMREPDQTLQTRLVLGNCGLIDPASIDEYVAVGGYRAFASLLANGSPEAAIEEIEKSGLRGRGGAGFPSGLKWRLTRQHESDIRYFIVNADEGDPGAYMDRGLLESDPHRVIEGAAIGAYAVGASQVYVFVRAEYPLVIRTLSYAISAAEDNGLLGEDILGSGYSLRIRIVASAGAFVCGEESALIRVLENRTVEPQVRPPYPSEIGLWGRPTCINNVETLANIPYIIARGSNEFRRYGTSRSPGTKVFSLVGSVPRTGLVEVPLGTPIDSIVKTIGRAESYKAVQIGGPSGAILPASLGNLPVDFESLENAGGIMGSGGLVALSNTQCTVDIVSYLTEFSASESCGKCTPCRDGLKECADILAKITLGRGHGADLERLELLASYISSASLCALGTMAPRPILSGLRYFEKEFRQHIGGRCLAHVCSSWDTTCSWYDFPHGCTGKALKVTYAKEGRIPSPCTTCPRLAAVQGKPR